jgi:hypothetical protein
MKSKILAAIVALTTCMAFVACGDDSSSSASDDQEISSSSTKKTSSSSKKEDKKNSSSSKKAEKGAYTRDYATAIAVSNTMFIGTMSLDHTEDIGKDFIEVGTRAGVVYYDGSLFINDLEIGSTARYSLDANNKIGKKQGEITLTGVWANHIYFVNEEKAYLGGAVDSLIIFNPKTMKITGSIDLSEYKDEGAMAVSPATGVIVDGRLYVALLQNVSDYATGNTAQVAIIDIKKDKVLAVAKDDRIAAVGSLDDSQNGAFIVAGDYIYTYCNGSWGYAPGQVDGFLRIKIGETEFDKDYVWKVSEEVGIDGVTKKGVFKYLAPLTKADGNVAYSYLNVMMDLQKEWASAENYYDYTCKAVKVDLAKKKMTALPIDYTSSWASYGKYIEEDGKVLFAVSTEEDGNAYFRYDPETGKAEKIASVEQIPMWIVPLK